MDEDPYDDFDPRNHVYETDEDAEDVVYSESGSQESLWMPLSLHHSQDLQGTQNSQSQQPSQRRVPTLLPRRERKRQRNQSLLYPHSDDSSEESNEEDDEDVFASVRSILEHKQQPETLCAVQEEQAVPSEQPLKNSRSRPTEKENEENESSSENKEADISKSTVPAEKDALDESTSNAIPNETSDDMVVDDWNTWKDPEPSSEENHPHGVDTRPTHGQYSSFAWNGSPAMSARLENEVRRQRAKQKQSKNVRQGSHSFLNDSIAQSRSITTELEKRRKQLHGENNPRQRRNDPSSQHTSQVETVRTPLASFSRDRPNVARSTSSQPLAGSRPQHWATLPRFELQGTAKHSRFGRHPSLAAKLAEATRPHVRSSSSSSSRDTGVMSSQTSRIPSTPGLNRLSGVTRRPGRASWPPKAGSAYISFTPAFMSTPNVSRNDSLLDTPTENDNPLQTPCAQRYGERGRHAVFSGGSSGGAHSAPNSANQQRKRKTSGNKDGPLLRRFKAIRGEVAGYWVCFQSGMYPFDRSRRHDLNDPRNRAKSHMDVTIVDQSVSVETNYKMSTMLAFVHSYVEKETSKPTSAQASEPDVNDEGSTNGSTGGFFAWICFSFDTARERNIQQWTQLRIYNAIIVPTEQSMEVPECCSNHRTETRSCNKVILCTKICEAYPSILPRLEGICIPANKGF